jgi:urea transport system substrate-binding protein
VLSTAGGAPNVTLTKQLRTAGITAQLGNLSIDEGTAKSMGADATGTYVSGSYFTSVESPANTKFMTAMKAKFGDKLLTPNDLSVPQYEAVHAYALAVKTVGSTDADKLIPELAKVSFDGPRGSIKMSKQRHTPLTMYLGQVQADGSVKVLATFKDVDPGEQCPKLG